MDPNFGAHRDLRRGVVWLSIGIGFVLIGACLLRRASTTWAARWRTLASFAAIGAVPACVGLAFLGLWVFGSRRAPPRG